MAFFSSQPVMLLVISFLQNPGDAYNCMLIGEYMNNASYPYLSNSFEECRGGIDGQYMARMYHQLGGWDYFYKLAASNNSTMGYRWSDIIPK